MKISVLLAASLALVLAAGAQESPPAPKPNTPPPAAPAPKLVLPEEAPPGPDWKIIWEIHVVTLPTATARPLLPELRDETTSAAGWTKVVALVAKKEATVALETGGQVIRGSDSEFSQVEELRYPVENERPEVVGPVKQPEPAPYGTRLPKPGEPKPVRYPIPVFDTRKIGFTIKVNAEVSEDGQRLIMDTDFEHTWFLRWDEFEVGRLGNNEKILYKQPHIGAVKRSGKSALAAGERLLLSAHPVPTVEGQTELVFLHVWTTLRKKADAK